MLGQGKSLSGNVTSFRKMSFRRIRQNCSSLFSVSYEAHCEFAVVLTCCCIQVDGISPPHMKAAEQIPAAVRAPQTEPDSQHTLVELSSSPTCACGAEGAYESSRLAAEGGVTAVSVHLANTKEGTVTVLLDVACESGGGACPEACAPAAAQQQQLQPLPGHVLELGDTGEHPYAWLSTCTSDQATGQIAEIV